MKVITPRSPPHDGRCPTVFLAGAIDDGRAELWQETAITALADLDIAILNPRRAEWKSEWSQQPDHEEFVHQVDWELSGIESADWVLMMFPRRAIAPICLLELGLRSHIGRMHVVCERDYWREGNVRALCRRVGLPCHVDLNAGLAALRCDLMG